MPRDARKYLHDIREACEAIRAFVEGETPDRYESNRQLRSSIEREFILIGEAMRQLRDLDPSFEDCISEVGKIISFRHQLVHGYDVIRHETVWKIIEEDLPTLLAEVSSLLAELGD